MSELTPYLSLSPAALAGLVVLMILTGKLVPVSMLRAQLAAKNEIIADLREALASERANSAQLRRGNGAAVQVLEALPEVVSAPAESPQDVV